MFGKIHYKMYKSGKLWCTALIAGLALAFGAGVNTATAHADVQTTGAQTTLVATQPQQKVNAATETEANQESGNANTATQTADTPVQNNNQAYDHNDQGNYANLDGWSFSDGHLRASGWQASNETQSKPYHYVILYDASQNRELMRQAVNPVDRPDVQQAHNVYAANQSGFNADFKLNDAQLLAVANDQLRIVSRYSDQAEGGEGQKLDYWFDPISMDHGNYGNLDSLKIADGKVTVSGWQASNQAAVDPYHWVILLANGHEVARQLVDDHQERNDVAAAYPTINNADQSGFQISFPLSSLSGIQTLQVVSRWSDDAKGGEGQRVDYWYNPVNIDYGNHGALDNMEGKDGKLLVSGWQATNQANSNDSHWLILFDASRGQEIARQKVAATARPDVAKALPTIVNAGQSGFSAEFEVPAAYAGDSLQVVSRYSNDDKTGEGQHVDYWFPASSTENEGHLDDFNLSNGQLTVSGWHATDASLAQQHRFLILYDNTDNRQVAVAKSTTVSRPDVAKAYSNIVSANNSGFSGSFADAQLVPGHTYSVVSRYSTSAEGNGDVAGATHTDYWSNQVTLDQRAYAIDNFQADGKQYKVSGWVADDNAINQPNAVVILLNHDNGQTRELGRAQITDWTDRSDVADAYSSLYRSGKSGFNVSFNVDPATVTGDLQLVLRFYSDDQNADSDSSQWTQNYPTNAGFFDQVKVNGDNVTVSGWHVNSQSARMPYSWLIVVEQGKGEIFRTQLGNGQTNTSRPDVAKLYGYVPGALNSGFNASFNIGGANKKNFYVIHRYSASSDGNSDYVDTNSAMFYGDVMRHPIQWWMPSETVPYPDLSQLSNFWIHVRIGQNRVYLMNGNDVVYTMYCTAGRYVNGVSMTPTGTYYVQPERGDEFAFAYHWTSWLNHGEYLFHSVIFGSAWSGQIDPSEAAKLGVQPGSHGCIRLSLPDADWIQHHVPTGTKVVIDN